LSHFRFSRRGFSANMVVASRSSRPNTFSCCFLPAEGWPTGRAASLFFRLTCWACSVGKDHSLIRRLRTLTFGLLTPFYFIRAGSFVSVQAIIAAPAALIILFMAKSTFKAVAVYPAVRFHRYDGSSGAYYTLMMSTGLTFGTISALFGLNHQIITQNQYSYLVGTVIASAVIPTLIANTFFLPRHLLPHAHANKLAEQPAQRTAVAEEV